MSQTGGVRRTRWVDPGHVSYRIVESVQWSAVCRYCRNRADKIQPGDNAVYVDDGAVKQLGHWKCAPVAVRHALGVDAFGRTV